MAIEYIGSGKIKVTLKDDQGNWHYVRCNTIEVYGGEKMAFSDEDQRLVRYDGTNKVVEAPLYWMKECTVKGK